LEGIRVPRTLEAASHFIQKVESLSQMPTLNQTEANLNLKLREEKKLRRNIIFLAA